MQDVRRVCNPGWTSERAWLMCVRVLTFDSRSLCLCRPKPRYRRVASDGGVFPGVAWLHMCLAGPSYRSPAASSLSAVLPPLALESAPGIVVSKSRVLYKAKCVCLPPLDHLQIGEQSGSLASGHATFLSTSPISSGTRRHSRLMAAGRRTHKAPQALFSAGHRLHLLRIPSGMPQTLQKAVHAYSPRIGWCTRRRIR